MEVLPAVNYMWKQTIAFSLFESIYSFILVFILFLVSFRYSSVFQACYYIVLLFTFVPLVVVSSVIEIDKMYVFFVFFSILFGLMQVEYLDRLKISTKKYISLSHLNIDFFFVIKVVTFLFLIMISATNFSKINFNLLHIFSNIYSIREENKMSPSIAYVSRFMISILSPILLYHFFKTKSYTSLVLACLSSFLLFSLFALKIQLLFFFLFTFVFYLIFVKRFDLFKVLLSFLICVCISSMALGVLGYNLFDRFLFLPALLNVLYLDFFTQFNYNFFEFSKLALIFGGSDYTKTLGFLIDDFYFGGGMNANTGFIASFFAELGFLGLFFAFTVLNILLMFLKILDEKYRFLGVVLAISLSFELMNAPLTNIFLSNGFFIMMLLPFFIKRGTYEHRRIR